MNWEVYGGLIIVRDIMYMVAGYMWYADILK